MTDPAQLVYGYARALDRLDAALLADAFHPDAQIDMGGIYAGGPTGFVEVAMGFMGQFAATRHDVANVLVAPDGADAATLEAYVTAWHRLDAPARTLTVLGRYLARVERRDGRWRIARWSEIIDWGEERPANAAWFDAPGPLAKGRRDRDDPSYAWLPATS